MIKIFAAEISTDINAITTTRKFSVGDRILTSLVVFNITVELPKVGRIGFRTESSDQGRCVYSLRDERCM